MPSNLDQKELYALIKESVKANTTNAETTKAVGKTMDELKSNMCQMNDNFTLHNLSQGQIQSDLAVVKKQLLKWLFISVIIIFTLLGGIVIAKELGLNVVDLIKG